MLKVSAVAKKSSAALAGLKKGDVIKQVNGYPAVDELDLLYFDGEEVELTVEGKEERITAYTDEFDVEGDNRIRTCYNHCIFCFVDQMPKGMRETLYVKDDDYGMSFECGNFVTLTNLSDEELDRIIRLNLSPLYVSVQTMNPQLRCKLLGNRFAGKIVEQIDKLAKAGIEIHCQSVIVPFQNDGEDMESTARKLFAYYPAVRDLALVPTGITKFREGLPYIPDVDGEYSAKLLDLVDSLNREFGVNFLLPADEYFIKAGRELKPAEFYGDFSQIENGIGMTTKFLSEYHSALSPCKLKKPKRSLVICGTSAGEVMKKVCEQANAQVEGLNARPLVIENDFFGHTVTCTGLLTGQDIFRALEREKGTYDEVILPSNTLREFTEDFLDGMTVKELKKKLGFKNIVINRTGGYGVAETFMGGKQGAFRPKREKKGKKPVLYEKKYDF